MPRTLSSYESARLEGMTAAQEEHQRLGTSMHERIPVFDVIEDSRIWLFFQPMRTLFGAYERHGNAAGIIINSQHPLSLQRFTAGHEYGHHVLGHEASADDEERQGLADQSECLQTLGRTRTIRVADRTGTVSTRV